jgi:hypothetical protein
MMDIGGLLRNVLRGPTDYCTPATESLFDHFVGAAEERNRERQAQCLGGLQIDNQFDLVA